MAELENLVEKMESGELPLEESLSAYQRGMELLKFCERLLADAQQRVQVLDSGADPTEASLREFADPPSS